MCPRIFQSSRNCNLKVCRKSRASPWEDGEALGKGMPRQYIKFFRTRLPLLFIASSWLGVQSRHRRSHRQGQHCQTRQFTSKWRWCRFRDVVGNTEAADVECSPATIFWQIQRLHVGSDSFGSQRRSLGKSKWFQTADLGIKATGILDFQSGQW